MMIRGNFNLLIKSFKQRYGSDTEDRQWEAVCKLNQRTRESDAEILEKYTEDIDCLIAITNKSEREKMEAVMRGLPSDIQRQVMCHKPKSVEAVMEYVRLLKPIEASTTANVTAITSKTSDTSLQQVIQESVAREIQIAISAITAVPQRQNNFRDNYNQTRNNGYGGGSPRNGGGSRSGTYITDCPRYGKSHMSNACFAFGQTCRGCGRIGHFQFRCLFGGAGPQSHGGAAAAARGSTQ